MRHRHATSTCDISRRLNLGILNFFNCFTMTDCVLLQQKVPYHEPILRIVHKHVIFAIASLDGVILLANSTAGVLLGTGQLEGQNIADLLGSNGDKADFNYFLNNVRLHVVPEYSVLLRTR